MTSPTYRIRYWTGPCNAEPVAARMREQGMTAHAGTEHVYFFVPAEDDVGACLLADELLKQCGLWPIDHKSDGASRVRMDS